MAPEWRYSEEMGGLFVVCADAKGSCSRRRFGALDGAFLDETPGPGRNYAELFKGDLKRSVRLGELRGRPNLEDAVRARKLPSDVLGELKSLARSIAGVSI
jgi:hypothetical protein